MKTKDDLKRVFDRGEFGALYFDAVEILEERNAERARADELATLVEWHSERAARAGADEAEALARAERAEAAVAAYRAAIKRATDEAEAEGAYHTYGMLIGDPVGEAIGRGWAPPDVARQAIEALEYEWTENYAPFFGPVRETLHANHATTRAQALLTALAALKKVVGE